jgi:hypothetical protein
LAEGSPQSALEIVEIQIHRDAKGAGEADLQPFHDVAVRDNDGVRHEQIAIVRFSVKVPRQLLCERIKLSADKKAAHPVSVLDSPTRFSTAISCFIECD